MHKHCWGRYLAGMMEGHPAIDATNEHLRGLNLLSGQGRPDVGLHFNARG